jgi:hypothetical protein
LGSGEVAALYVAHCGGFVGGDEPESVEVVKGPGTRSGVVTCLRRTARLMAHR